MKLRIILVLLILFVFVLFGSFSNLSNKAQHMYIETTHGYSNVGGEILRFDSKREFTIQDFSTFETKVNGSTLHYANISMTASDTNGIVETTYTKMNVGNFLPTFYYHQNNKTMEKVEWKVSLARIPQAFESNPFNDNGFFTDRTIDSRTYDRKVESFKFSTSLEYYEYQVIEGKLTKLFVDVELSTDNYNSSKLAGLIYNTAMHIVKRDPDSNILYSYSLSIKEANQMQRFINLLDRPDSQLVPFQFGALILVIYIYMRAVKYWKDNNFRIVRGEKNEPEKETEHN